VKASCPLPVIANGDIDSPERARHVLRTTGADAVMIGRAAQGRPWIFREIDHYLRTGETLPAPSLEEIGGIVRQHLHDLHAFYGEPAGVRIARKHIGWSVRALPGGEQLRGAVNRIDAAEAQRAAVNDYFLQLDPSLRLAA
jgi:tRNA-dihydrouridine synthase B